MTHVGCKPWSQEQNLRSLTLSLTFPPQASPVGSVQVEQTHPISQGVEAVAKIAQTRHDVVFGVETLVDKGGDDPHLGHLLGKVVDALGASDQVDEEDALLRHALGLEHLDGHDGAAARGQHGVEQQHPAVADVWRELLVEQLGQAGLLVALDQDLADAHGPAALAQALLHRLARAHDADAADLALELDARVLLAHGRGHRVRHHGEVVQAFLDEEPDDPVGVEDEVGPLRVFVPDHREQRDELGRLWEDVHVALFHLP